MSNGLSPDVAMGIMPPEVRMPEPQKNFTPLREFEKPMVTEPPKFEEPTVTEPPRFEESTTTNDPAVDKLMADILAQGQQQKPQEVAKEVEKNLPAEAKKQGFLTKIWESIKNFFKNFFR